MKTEVIGDPKAFHLQFATYPLSEGGRTMAMYFDGPNMLDHAWGSSVRDCMDVMAARREVSYEDAILASYSTPGLRRNMLADTVVLPSTVEREGADGQADEAHRVQGS